MFSHPGIAKTPQPSQHVLRETSPRLEADGRAMGMLTDQTQIGPVPDLVVFKAARPFVIEFLAPSRSSDHQVSRDRILLTYATIHTSESV